MQDYRRFEENHGKLQTIRLTSTIGIEHSTSRLPALIEESLSHWWGSSVNDKSERIGNFVNYAKANFLSHFIELSFVVNI